MKNTSCTPKSSIGAPANPDWLHELREIIPTNFHLIMVFDNSEWDILVRLPHTEHWSKELNGTARDVLFDEYEVVYLDDLEEDISGQEAPHWLQTLRQAGQVICHTPEMNGVIDALLSKLDGLSEAENHVLTRMVELTSACLKEHQLNRRHESELELTVQGLRGLPLWQVENLIVH